MPQDPSPATSSLTLVRYTATAKDRIRVWTELSAEDLRRQTIKAARDRDHLTLWAITEAFLLLHRDPSPHTLKSYKDGVVLTLEQLAQTNITKPQHNWGHLFVRGLEVKGHGRKNTTIKPATVRSRVAAAKALFAALRWAGATEVDPFLGVRMKPDPEAPEEKRPPYSQEAIDLLLTHAKPRERAIILLGAHGGLRNMEISSLMADDVMLEQRQLQVQKGKGNKPRKVNLSKRVCEALAALERKPGQAVIGLTPQGVREAIRRLCEKIGMPYQGIHALRHTSGTRLYRATRDLKAVARHLGQKKVETAAIYAKFAEEDLRNVMTEW
jgi:integrase